MSESKNITDGLGWVFYDGRCPWCRRLIRRQSHTLIRRCFLAAPLQRGWVQQRLGLPPDELLKEMRVLTAGGRVIGGAEAAVYLARRIWWARPLYAVSRIPGAMRPLGALYRLIARNRYCLSGRCPGRPSPQTGKPRLERS